MNLKKRYLVLFLLIFGLAILAGCGTSEEPQDGSPSGETAQTATGNSDDAAAGDTGAAFREYPIGEEQEVEGMKIAAVYFQPVLMEPAGKGLTPDQADMHIEADISALPGNKVGFGAGSWVPYLTVNYELENLENGKVIQGTFMPMSASDGPHYGANVKLPGAGKYKVTYLIDSPEKMGYFLHVDEATGVEGHFWREPVKVSWEFNWIPRKW